MHAFCTSVPRIRVPVRGRGRSARLWWRGQTTEAPGLVAAGLEKEECTRRPQEAASERRRVSGRRWLAAAAEPKRGTPAGATCGEARVAHAAVVQAGDGVPCRPPAGAHPRRRPARRCADDRAPASHAGGGWGSHQGDVPPAAARRTSPGAAEGVAAAGPAGGAAGGARGGARRGGWRSCRRGRRRRKRAVRAAATRPARGSAVAAGRVSECSRWEPTPWPPRSGALAHRPCNAWARGLPPLSWPPPPHSQAGTRRFLLAPQSAASSPEASRRGG